MPIAADKHMHGKDSDSRESGARQMIRAIVGMAHGLDLKVVAEGVENALQHKVIKNEACDLSQGFFITSQCQHR